MNSHIDRFDDENIVIDRVNFTHILLISLIKEQTTVLKKDKELTISNSTKLTSSRKNYLIMKKSRKKRWDDISFYNYNEVALKEEGLFYISNMGGCNEKIILSENNESNSFKNISGYFNQEKIREYYIKKIKKHLSTEYNIISEIFNIKPIENKDEIRYVKKSETSDQTTLYNFFFYYISPYKDYDLNRISNNLKNNKSELIKIINKNSFGLFDSICGRGEVVDISVDTDKKIKLFLKEDSIYKSVSIEGKGISLFNSIAEDQINELALRETSIAIPEFVLNNIVFSNLHPNFRFHGVFKKLINNIYMKESIIRIMENNPYSYKMIKKRQNREIGFIMIDLIDCKSFYQSSVPNPGYDYLNAFQNEVVDIIHKNSGYVIQTSGDGIYAVVESPVSERSSLKPYNCKKNIYEKMIRIALMIQKTGWKTRIGLDFSNNDFFEGFFGPLELGEYTITGTNVNIASRLESKIKKCRIKHGILLPAPNDININWIKKTIKTLFPDDSFTAESVILSIPEAVACKEKQLKNFTHIFQNNDKKSLKKLISLTGFLKKRLM